MRRLLDKKVYLIIIVYMNLKREALFITLLVICGFAAQRPGATFLLIPPSAKATGMAYAYTAVCNDASANYYNAAGLTFLNSPTVSVNYCGYLPNLHPDMHYGYFGLAYPLYNSAWGFDITFFTLGYTAIIRDNVYYGDSLVWRLALKLNYARRIKENLSFGIGWKLIRQKYSIGEPWVWWPGYYGIGIDPGGTGNSWAFDFNFLYRILPNLSIGAILHNVGPNIKYTETDASDPLPRLSRLGVAYTPLDNKYFSCTFSAEVTKVLTSMFVIEENSFWENLKYEVKEAWKGVGLEFIFYKIVSLHGGYFYDEEGQRKGLTFGGGVNIAKFEFDIGIDKNIFDYRTENRYISLSYTF